METLVKINSEEFVKLTRKVTIEHEGKVYYITPTIGGIEINLGLDHVVSVRPRYANEVIIEGVE